MADDTHVKSAAEVGSPEFAEDRTQINSLNNKWIFESAMDQFWKRGTRSDDFHGKLESAAFESLMTSVNLTKQLHSKFFTDGDDRARLRDQWNYITAYDLSNPVTTGSADSLRGNVAPANRATDMLQNATSGGVGVSAEAVAAAVAKQVDATITPVLATLQQIVQALATATTGIANVLNQAQPKTGA